MTQPGLSDLTEKEKEALRLLLAGHDAKSSAVELDLSVHTINDRLRSARRKLSVSSSREAARILGFAEEAAEQADPQISAHTQIGMAETAIIHDPANLTNTQGSGPFGLSVFTGAMLIMSLFIAATIIAVVSNTGDKSTASLTPDAPETSVSASGSEDRFKDTQSLPRAQSFLAQTDAGDWANSWKVAGEFFQQQASAEEWAKVVKPVRGPLGALKERRLAGVQKANTLPGAPEGEYEVLQFQTRFASEERLFVETVVMIRNGDGFDVAGYFIR